MTQTTGFTSYKGRSLRYGQKVKVYRNLHKDTYSIVDYTSGKVIGYADSITLKQAEFRVSEAGRQRVLRDKQKNVHAFVVGTFVSTTGGPERYEAYYNPYKTKTFVVRNVSGDIMSTPLTGAARVRLHKTGVTFTGAT